jgi:hypothetical protein
LQDQDHCAPASGKRAPGVRIGGESPEEFLRRTGIEIVEKSLPMESPRHT